MHLVQHRQGLGTTLQQNDTPTTSSRSSMPTFPNRTRDPMLVFPRLRMKTGVPSFCVTTVLEMSSSF